MAGREGPYRRDNNSTSYVHPNEENLTNLHRAMDYNAAGQPIVRVAGSEAFGDINIAIGNVNGMTQVFRHGYNANFANGVEESYWDGSSAYPWSAWNSGDDTLTIVSTGADNGTVTIKGLDANYELQTDTITLTGTTPVTTTTSWIRVHDLSFTDGSSNVGTITASANSTVVAQINTGFGNNQSGQYTVPAGYTAFLFHGQANVGKGNDGVGKFKYRLFGGTFYTGLVFMLYESVFNYKFTTPFVLPEKTDLDVTLVVGNSGTQSSCAYDIILVNNDNLT